MRNLVFLLLTLFFLSCSNNEEEKALFKVVDPNLSNLKFTNTLTETKALNILDYLYYYNGGGVAIGDINNDGLPDIYFTGNQVQNKLFLNKGNLKFKDITKSAGVAGNSDWNTGTTMADVNGDGYLDIYICAVVGINGLTGKNELFINNGDNTFTEKAEAYGLDFENYSSTAAFFDYDNDGDLDIYLLNHAVHTVYSYGPAKIRNNRKENSGDKLMRNDDGKFVDVSEEAGIYGGPNGYGLGVATADFNNDGYTDIYVSNDFHEDDYYYINNGDGTFDEKLKEKFGHTSRFSMGSDVADINQDGFMDILTLDMLPEDEKVLKSSVGDDPLDLHNMKIEQLGYHYQFTRNMLQINQGGEYFKETALLSGIAATDWSWSALFGDYNLDGNQDLFISTGIPKRPNDLDYIKYVSTDHIQKKMNTTRLVDDKALDMMPSGKVHNYIFKGSESLKFQDKSGKWIPKKPTVSTGAAYGDLDNDGDLDIVTNNINKVASLYANKTNGSSNYLKIKFDYPAPNTKGIGTKVISYVNGKMQLKQLFSTRGFQSSSEPLIHFGYQKAKKIDSLLIIWPDFTSQTKYDVATNQSLNLSPAPQRDSVNYNMLFHQKDLWFQKLDSIPGIDFVHEENPYIDFNRQKLIPYQISDRGPAVAVTDFNGDGKDDIFFGNSKFRPSKIYLQTLEGFVEKEFPVIAKDSIMEWVSVAVKDFNKDGTKDMFLVSGGGEFYGEAEALLDRMYFNTVNKGFEKQEIPPYFENGSIVVANDYNKDGFIDLFVGGAAVSNDFGKIPNSYLLLNKNEKFTIQENKELQKIGMVTDAVWTDFNKDGWMDLIVVGEWMGPKFFENDHGTLKNATNDFLSESIKGLWQSIVPFDINKDGKMDYLLGNWGLNTKFRVSEKYPLKMYYADFDKNGSTETILAHAKNDVYYSVLGLDKLVGQLSYLRKKFPSYESFAGQPLEAVFPEQQLKNAKLLEVNILASGYLLNTDGSFTFKKFSEALQTAPITAFLKADFNKDGSEDILVGGNYFGVTPYHGRFDGLAGNIILGQNQIIEGFELGLNFTQKAVVSLDLLEINNEVILMVTYNDEKPEFYKLRKP